MDTENIIQGSDEWFAIRCGKVTASRMADVTARTKTGWGASRANYMAELIAERLTGMPAERFQNAAMQWGTDHEPEAISAYEFTTGNDVERVGFVSHGRIKMSGASPDGRVGKQGLIEVKCPNTATHIDTLLTGKIPDKYIKQTHWQMVCDDRKWCDFVSYDPRLPEDLRLFIKRVELNESVAVDMERDVENFLQELEEKLGKLSKLRQAA